MKDRFTPDEWRSLLFLPVLIYDRVAGADGTLDPEEFDRFDQDLLDSEELANPLMREIFTELSGLAEAPQWLDQALPLVRSASEEMLSTARRALEQRLEGPSYHRFVAALVVWGLGLAQASGGFLGLFGSKVSRQELAALQELADFFGLDPAVWSPVP